MHKKIFTNVLSNWAGLFFSIVIAFFVSPVIVHSLGNDLYGVWMLICSITGYFTVLDFGVNTAVVRFISSSKAQENYRQARKVYSTALVIFTIVGVGLLLFFLIFGYFFQNIFKLYHISQFYLYAVFLISGMDLAIGILFSVFLGALNGLQEFKFLNGSSILINIARSIAIVYLLSQGYGLMALAFMQLGSSLLKVSCQYLRIKTGYKFLYFSREYVTRDSAKLIYSYSVYSFIIAISLKLLFYTDAVVIGIFLDASEVTFYAIPSSLLDHLEKVVWAMIAVLIPVISASEAIGEGEKNAGYYITGTQFSLLISMPFVISLYFFGDDFIRLWMGQEIGDRSLWVLRLLLIGFSLAFSQLIAQGILKGISKHKVLSYILSIEAFVNVVLSIVLVKPFGIEGVAFGTMLPLIVASLIIIVYTCRVLNLQVVNYMARAYSGSATGLLVALILIYFINTEAQSYVDVFLKSGFVAVVFIGVALFFTLNKIQKEKIINLIRKKLRFRSER